MAGGRQEDCANEGEILMPRFKQTWPVGEGTPDGRATLVARGPRMLCSLLGE